MTEISTSDERMELLKQITEVWNQLEMADAISAGENAGQGPEDLQWIIATRQGLFVASCAGSVTVAFQSSETTP